MEQVIWQESPIDILNAMEQESVSSIAEKAISGESNDLWTGVGFQLCGKQMAISLEHVAEIISVPTCAVLPHVNSWVVGLANHRGALIPILDIENLMGSVLSTAKEAQRVVLIHNQEHLVGLLVGKIFGLKHFSSLMSLDETAYQDESYAPYLMGKSYEENNAWLRFDVDRMIEDFPISKNWVA